MLDPIDIILNLISEKCGSDVAFENDFGLKPKTVSNWKRDKSQAYLKILNRLCDYFDVTADYILGRSLIKNASETLAPENQELMNLIPDLTPAEAMRAKEYVAFVKRERT